MAMRLSDSIELGQEKAKFSGQVRVLVQDLRDKPIPGIEVEVRNGVSSLIKKTDWRGVAIVPFETSSDSVDVVARLPEGPALQSQVTTARALKEPIVFRSVDITPEPFLTPVELVSGAVGIVAGAIGFIRNIEWLKAVGEAFFVVALFSKVARSR